MSEDSLAKIQAVKNTHTTELLKKANVVGVGVGIRERGAVREPVLVVMVSRKVPLNQLAPKDIVPASIDDVPVDVREVGDISAQ